MTAISFLSYFGAEWTIPFAVCPMIYVAFSFTEGVASPAAKQTLTAFIKNGMYESYLGSLPGNVESLFVRVFGESHLSKKCVLQSIKFSLITTTLATALVIVVNHHLFHQMLLLYPKINEYMHKTPPTTPELKRSYEIVHDLMFSRLWLVFAPVLWIGWSLVPDYLSLLKTRIVLVVLNNIKVSQHTILFVAAIDFFLGLLVFFASFVFFQLLYLNIIFIVDGQPLAGGFRFYVVVFWTLFSIEFLSLTLTGAVFLYLPVSSLFWASLVPSLWMWAYVGAAMVARASLKSKKFRRAIVYFLDFEDKPIKSLGFIASSVSGVVSLFCVAVYSLM